MIYIDVQAISLKGSCQTIRFESFVCAEVLHNTFAELLQGVLAHCPEGFQCIDHANLQHKDLWEIGLRRRLEGTGSTFAPIDEKEYEKINWTDSASPVMACVEIQRVRHQCTVKYIHMKDGIPKDTLHNLEDYEFAKADVAHGSFQELLDAVHLHCPPSYVCVDPVALHHEILWESSLRLNPAGTHYVVERDQLFHAIDEVEYARLQWTVEPKTPGAKPHLLSVCVDINQTS